MKKFEYVSLQPPAFGHTPEESPRTKMLKEMGARGWELCAVAGPYAGGTLVFYFKREVE